MIKIKDNATYKKALKRNLNEVVMAKLEFEAYREISNKLQLNFYDSFFVLAQDALFNDMVAHMIKVLDRDSQSATFWYIFNCKSEKIKEFINREKVDFMAIYDISEKFKKVRDKSHFHIDRKGVMNPKSVWVGAGITYGELEKNINFIYEILNHLYVEEFKYSFDIPKIDDLQYIIKASINAEYATAKLTGTIKNR